ncbi:ATPase family protein associated with various cellular activities (AAA) [Chitinophaga niastensis]|uniref:ATPase family protein associated with various cellular activities (AAA) n=1 Tax=Chitinophaga niastensis TaxID=536980 RepID=A0A2P8HGK4_CHINA|nr:ATP-binding protein [Chitinophaga niastensis]PSL45355.1 ATPase family protein associated with various cellular activities (AAA) [Chitinophaga niastensis]
MGIQLIAANAAVLQEELEWFRLLATARMQQYFEGTTQEPPPPPDLRKDTSVYAQIVTHYRMNEAERIILLLALIPHIHPQLLDIFFVKNATYDRGFTEFGGIKGVHHGGFLPTGETAAFLLASSSLQQRFILIRCFSPDHFFAKHQILKLTPAAEEPLLSGTLTLSAEYLSLFTQGVAHQPDYNIHFPAKRIETGMEWEDLVLESHAMEEVEEIRTWIEYGRTLLDDWGMSRKIKPGYRSLFYGPPGTGKSLTACLLGKTFNMDVYRIDLSLVVSKFIGETEKNLAMVFDRAINQQWILFFDEADALFGKRTQTSSSNDRYANQEVAYLLQRIEDFPGVVILATNLKANIDEAFSRRFQSMIYFSIPSPEQRLRIWQKSFPDHVQLEDKLNLEEIAKKHEMAGGTIINVVRYSCLMALKQGGKTILQKDVIAGIRKEYGKDGKIV